MFFEILNKNVLVRLVAEIEIHNLRCNASNWQKDSQND